MTSDGSGRKWAVIIVETERGFDPERLVRWASRKGLLHYVNVHIVDKDTAREVDKEMYSKRKEGFVVPEAEGDDEDLYELLGF